MSTLDFIESIRIVPDKEKEMLLRIQQKIEETGINKKYILALTKNLSDSQKERLKQLYNRQIEDLNHNIEQYKTKIINIKAKALK